MGADDVAWRGRLVEACERTLAELKARRDPATHRLIADVEALRDRLRQETDADEGPARATEIGAGAPPQQPQPNGK